jgi:Ti-type conjugative transfer relaxase TraA
MMSISSRGSAGAAAAYFQSHLRAGEYYTSSPGAWHGSAATEALRLPQAVVEQDFVAIIEGMSPDGRAMVQGCGPQHRSGWDATFSAPKSVSVLWTQLRGSQRLAIEQAQSRAVHAALQLLERQAIRVRIGKGGSAQVPAAMLAACFAHETSRDLDPQLHTHAFVANCGLRPDGKFGALESRHLYAWHTAVGTAYRAQLAEELRQLGYTCDADARAFCVRGVPDSVCKAFAKRRATIEAIASSRGATSSAGLEAATLASRAEKVEIDSGLLYRQWREEGKSLGFGDEQAAALANAQPATELPVDLDDLLLELTAHAAVFREQDLWRAVAERVQSAGGGLKRVEQIVDRLQAGDELVALPEHRYTTRTMLLLEESALLAAGRLCEQRGQGCALVASDRTLSAEQSRALAHVLADGGLRLIEGRAGTGKSYLLGVARECWEQAGYRVLGAALAGKAAQGLEEGSGIRGQTLHSLLAQIDGGQLRLNPRTVLVIDEAAMVGTAQMERLLSISAAAGAKLVMVGDSRQLQSIDAGGVFRRLSIDVGAAELAEIRRQKQDKDREAVIHLMEGRAGEALQTLDELERIHIKDGQPATIAAMVDDWSKSYDPRNPSSSMMLAATRADVREINAAARGLLRERGQLGMDVVQAGGCGFAIGDRVLFLRNDRAVGVKNGTLGIVRGGEGDQLIVEIDGGAEIAVDVGTYPHLTHGYAITVHKAQGVTTDRVFLFLSDRMSSREWGYVAGSRHRDELHLYSDRSVYASMADDLSVSRPQTLALDEMPRTAGAAAGDEAHRVPSSEVHVELGRAVDLGGPSTRTIRADDRDVGDAELDAADDVDQTAPGM